MKVTYRAKIVTALLTVALLSTGCFCRPALRTVENNHFVSEINEIVPGVLPVSKDGIVITYGGTF